MEAFSGPFQCPKSPRAGPVPLLLARVQALQGGHWATRSPLPVNGGWAKYRYLLCSRCFDCSGLSGYRRRPSPEACRPSVATRISVPPPSPTPSLFLLLSCSSPPSSRPFVSIFPAFSSSFLSVKHCWALSFHSFHYSEPSVPCSPSFILVLRLG
jgi:hypothetical protein